VKPYFSNLDLERFGIVNKAEPVTPEPVIKRQYRNIPCDKKHVSEKHDQMMFNAGRFAGGARDKVATEAHEQLMKELGE
jgi:hypothetical protein